MTDYQDDYTERFTRNPLTVRASKRFIPLSPPLKSGARGRSHLQGNPQWYVFIPWLLFAGVSWPAKAQIIPDSSLPVNSAVTQQGNINQIEGGTQAGENLFHSFENFSLPTGAEAFFNNGLDIQNIFSRVTGNSISNIDGLIRGNGTANLFLLNPNGIVFGSNAQLNIGGSFFATTANSLLFPDRLEFNTKVETNGDSPLLSVNVPIGLQMGVNPGNISVNGTGISDVVPRENLGLAVAPGQTIALVGGDINFNGGILAAPSGRIEIGSLANGQVGIIQTPGGFALNYDSVNQFANIQLAERSSLFSAAVFDNPLNEINVTGNNIVLDGSQIVALTNGNSTSGKINVRAAESLELGGTISAFPFSAWIVNQVTPGATGNSGDIQVTAERVSINNGARIQTISQGFGTAGNVAIDAAESLQISGFGLPPGFDLESMNVSSLASLAIAPETFLEETTNSRISSENFAGGAGGTVTVSTQDATFLAGGQITTIAGSEAIANGGNIHVNANSMRAENSLPFNGRVPSGVVSYTLGQGNGGSLTISTDTLSLIDGALLSSWTQGSGRGGEMIVNAKGAIAAEGVNPRFPIADAGILSITLGAGNSGNMEVSTANLTVDRGAQISSRSLIELLGISGPYAGTGNAGNVSVNADTIELTGTSPLALENLSIIGSLTFGSGDAGDVTISTRTLRVLDGAQVLNVGLLSISALGEPRPGSGTGNGGDLTVNASEFIEIVGVNPLILSLLGTNNLGLGNIGKLTVNTPRLTVQDGASLGTNSTGSVNGGSVTVNASEILVTGTSDFGIPSSISANAIIVDEIFQEAFFASPIPTGNTGELTVNSDRLTITNGGEVTIEHQGTGNAGRLQINVNRLNLNNGGRINAATEFGFGGNVEINVGDSLQLRNNSVINVEARGDIGDGGNLAINADTIVALENSGIIANAVGGNGGNIRIDTQGLFVSPNSDITASSQLGVGGVIEISQDLDVIKGLIELPENIVDATKLIYSICRPGKQQSQFIVTGKGGLPPNPIESIGHEATWIDLRPRREFFTQEETQNRSVSLSSNPLVSAPTSQLVEAQGLMMNMNGNLELVAEEGVGCGV